MKWSHTTWSVSKHSNRRNSQSACEVYFRSLFEPLRFTQWRIVALQSILCEPSGKYLNQYLFPTTSIGNFLARTDTDLLSSVCLCQLEGLQSHWPISETLLNCLKLFMPGLSSLKLKNNQSPLKLVRSIQLNFDVILTTTFRWYFHWFIESICLPNFCNRHIKISYKRSNLF